jgi:hypothetical protein
VERDEGNAKFWLETVRLEKSRGFGRAEILRIERLVADLADGRTIMVPLAWFPRLARGTPAERANWRLIAAGEGVHWPDLDEDISVESLLAGRRSSETQESLRRWLERRGSAG